MAYRRQASGPECRGTEGPQGFHAALGGWDSGNDGRELSGGALPEVDDRPS